VTKKNTPLSPLPNLEQSLKILKLHEKIKRTQELKISNQKLILKCVNLNVETQASWKNKEKILPSKANTSIIKDLNNSGVDEFSNNDLKRNGEWSKKLKRVYIQRGFRQLDELKQLNEIRKVLNKFNKDKEPPPQNQIEKLEIKNSITKWKSQLQVSQ
jgi:hypothetical protein